MKRTQIYLKEEHYDYLVKEARNEGKSIAQIIRELVDKRITSKKKGMKIKSFWEIGEDGFTTGLTDGSVNHDDVIYRSNKMTDG